MKRFAALYAAIDGTTRTNEKVEAMAQYLGAAAPEDAAWAIHFLIGRRPKRLIETRKLVGWAIEESGLPAWIFDECYQAVGDLAETISLLLPAPSASTDLPLHFWVEERLLPLSQWDDDAPARVADGRMARDGRGSAVRLEQADHGRIPGGCFAEPGSARNGQVQRH